MNELKVFDHPTFGSIRTVELNGEPWFVIGELAKYLRQNGVQTGQKRLFEQLRKDGFLISRQGADYNLPTQRAMEMGLFRIKETAIAHPDGHVSVSRTPKVTGKGQTYFINRYLGTQSE